jgi:hypothetical protein
MHYATMRQKGMIPKNILGEKMLSRLWHWGVKWV